jgi:EAL domain-containing protein (putative c-di-GMP-specific phosphodiesterase class I)
VQLVGDAVAVRNGAGGVIGYRGARRPVAVDTQAGLARAAADDRITRVLADRGFNIALQPSITIATGRVSGVEALARFGDGRGPEAWFQDAAACGRTCDLDAQAFTAALRLFAVVPHPVDLSVNASPELLMDQDFRAGLSASEVPFNRLVIEVTEHAHIADYAKLNVAIDPLRDLGVRFAIDDTGAGYASLNHVLELRPDVIKLDRTLITHLNEDRARRSLVTALVLLALDLGASVTGEGVETFGQLETLATLGVDQAQGYVLAKPTLDRTQWEAWWDQPWVSPHIAMNAAAHVVTGQDDVPTSR